MRKVRIFVSMSFEDMYSEREFLYSEVFPELQSWCRGRRLELQIIDPGYGLKEEECRSNPDALEVTLAGIDRARPIFLCFFGQKRGFIPRKEDLSEEFFRKYPGAEGLAGRYSLQELAVLHALFQPFNRKDPEKAEIKVGREFAPQAVIYRRLDDFISDAVAFQPKFKALYSNEPKAKSLFSRENRVQTEAMRQFRDQVERSFQITNYQARFLPEGVNPLLADEAELSRGSLGDFRIPAQIMDLTRNPSSAQADRIIPPQPLKEHILASLKEAIRSSVRGLLKDGEEDEKDPEIYVDTMRSISLKQKILLAGLPAFQTPEPRKILLKELREAPSVEDFLKTAAKEYGNTRESAVRGMLKRLILETDGNWLPRLTGLLAYHKGGISWKRLSDFLPELSPSGGKDGLPLKVRRVLFYLSDEIECSDRGIFCRNDDFKAAAAEISAEGRLDYIRLFVDRYLKDCAPEGEDLRTCRFRGESPEGFAQLPFYLKEAAWDSFRNLLANPYFLQKKAFLCGMPALFEDFAALRDRQEWDEYRQLYRILTLTGTVMEKDPHQLYVQLILRMGEHPSRLVTEILNLLKEDTEQPRLLPVQYYGENADSPLESRVELDEPEGSSYRFWDRTVIARRKNRLLIYDRSTGRSLGRFDLEQKSPVLVPCGQGLLSCGSLAEPVYSIAPSTFECRKLFPGHPELAAEKGSIRVFLMGDRLAAAAVFREKQLIVYDPADDSLICQADLSEPACLLEAQENCLVYAAEGEDPSVCLWSPEKKKVTARIKTAGAARAFCQIRKDQVLVWTPFEVFLFSLTEEKLLFSLSAGEEQSREDSRGSIRTAALFEDLLMVSRAGGLVETYSAETGKQTGQLKLHESAVCAIRQEKKLLFTADVTGVVCSWNRSQLDQKEASFKKEGSRILDIFQANGSVYTFRTAYSSVLSPVNLKERRRGIPVKFYSPEIRYRRYLVTWKEDPLKLMLLNTETLQNDYECAFQAPEGFAPSDLKNAGWVDTTGYLLYQTQEGRTAVQFLNMNTDRAEKVFCPKGARRGSELVFTQEGVFLFSREAEREDMKTSPIFFEILPLEEETPVFYLTGGRSVRLGDAFLDGGLLVFSRQELQGEKKAQYLVSIDITGFLKREEKAQEKAQVYRTQITAGTPAYYSHQNGAALYTYAGGGCLLYRYTTGEILLEDTSPAEKITACSLNRSNCFLARRGGQVEYHSYEDPEGFCCAFLDCDVRRMVGTGAGLVTVWTADDAIISFQMEKARKKEERIL